MLINVLSHVSKGPQKAWKRFKAKTSFRINAAVEHAYRSNTALWLLHLTKAVGINQLWDTRAPYMAKAAELFFTPSSKILEIGTWMGLGSTRMWLQHLPKEAELICLDRWEPYLSSTDLATGFNPYTAMNNLHRTALNISLNAIEASGKQNVVVIKSPSAQALSLLKENSFDFVYVDGSHYYPQVKNDLVLAKKLVKPGGILCGDDLELLPTNDLLCLARKYIDRDYICLSDGRCYHPGVMLAISEEIPILSVYCGFWICRKTQNSFEPVQLQAANELKL